MTKNQLVDRCKTLIAEAYEEATEMIVAYLETHDDKRQTLCKEIDPENWEALDARVRRLQEKRRSEVVSVPPISGPNEHQKGAIRGARSGIRQHPELVAELIKDPEVRKAVESEIAKDDDSVHRVVNQQTRRIHGDTGEIPERSSRPRPVIDYDEQFQDAGATVVYRLTDWQQGKWEPNERSQFVLHFLRRAVNDPTPSEAQALVDEITTYLEGVDLR